MPTAHSIEAATSGMNVADFSVNDSFASHLPLILIDTIGENIMIHETWDNDKGHMVPIQGIEPNVLGTLYIFSNGTASNHLTDAPTWQTPISIRRRGNSSMSYEKAQYKINLQTETGQENRLPLLGMDDEDEWVLSGSMIDKSLMRNYLAYTTALQIMPYAPEVRYCEVFLLEDGKPIYQGVYLLTESIKQGPGRVEINTTDSVGSTRSYMLRRDRLNPDGIMLDTYATREQLSEGFLELLYPKNEEATPDVIRVIEKEISNIEQVIYSDDPSVFLTYPNYINVDSFVDYFLINEFFTNYDAGFHSTYYYKDLRGKLCIGPVWDFDGTIDNYVEQELYVENMPFYHAPWFDRLVNHTEFVEKLVARYHVLRKSVLAEDSIMSTIDQTARYLGPAEKRDWLRWNHVYTGYHSFTLLAYTNDEGHLIHRLTRNYDQELIKIRYLLGEHGKVMKTNLKNLIRETGMVSNASDVQKNTILVIGFILLFFSVAVIARRE